MIKKHRFHELIEADSEGTWAISYGDLLTLLLVFFIIFFSADKFIKQNKNAVDLAFKLKVTTQMIHDIQKGLFPDAIIEDIVKAKVYPKGNKIYVEFFGVSFFKSADVKIQKEAQKLLTHFYHQYEPYMSRYSLAIRAFSDPRPMRAEVKRKYVDNIQLSTLRSLEVMRFLEKTGVPLNNMRIQGYGELKLTQADLARLEDETLKRNPASLNDLARTVILVIEPKEEL
jgi:flagellar motor protein MotB